MISECVGLEPILQCPMMWLGIVVRNLCSVLSVQVVFDCDARGTVSHKHGDADGWLCFCSVESPRFFCGCDARVRSFV